MTTLDQHIDKIREACQINKVKSLFAFGSVTRNELKAKSDIDLIVEIIEPDPLSYSDYYFDLKEKLEKVFNRPIDLLEAKAIRNPFLKAEIDRTKVLIYGK